MSQSPVINTDIDTFASLSSFLSYRSLDQQNKNCYKNGMNMKRIINCCAHVQVSLELALFQRDYNRGGNLQYAAY